MAYSALASIKDFSTYHLDEITQLAQNMDMTITLNGMNKIVQWSDKKTSLTVEYHLDGRFHRFVEETWKETQQTFKR